MAKVQKHPEFPGVTSETHPNLVKSEGGWYTKEEKPGYFKGDGTPRKWVDPKERLANAGPRRSNEELLKDYREKLVKAKERHAKEIAGIEKKIAYFENGGGGSRGVDPEKAKAAAAEMLSKGLTPEQILQIAEQAKLAAAAIKGKSEDEIKAIAATPSFLAVTPPAPAAV